MREKLIELICEKTQDGCECYCNHPYCEECKRLADYLIANGVTVQKWISVEDRLPEEDGKYLVLNESGNMFDTEYSDYSGFGYWRMYYDPDPLALAGSEWYELDDITHWMPLPEPPKGE